MKILIVDDHPLFREGLAQMLRQLDEGLETIEANSYETALAALLNDPEQDLMLLDLNMPGKDGFSILEEVGQAYPALPVAVLSASRSQNDVDRVLATSAMGYIPKDASSQIILSAVRLILAGGIYTPQLMQVLNTDGVPDILQSLTPRQREVLSMLVLGHANKRIADQLNITVTTTKQHISAIFKVLGVSNRTEATVEALKLGV